MNEVLALIELENAFDKRNKELVRRICCLVLEIYYWYQYVNGLYKIIKPQPDQKLLTYTPNFKQ